MNAVTRGVVIFQLLLATLVSVASAQTCHTSADGTCAGDCPRERPICAKLGGSGTCSCQGSIILEPFTQPRTDGDMLMATFTAEQVGSEGGKAWLEPGNSIGFTQATSVKVSIKHSNSWGGGSEFVTVPSGILRFVVHLEDYDPANPDRVRFDFTSLSAVLPSFPSVALHGDPTGDNVFSELGHATAGWIDTKTGDFAVNVYAKYFNKVFCSAPAIVQGHFEGNFDADTKQAVIRYSPVSVSMISDSPGDHMAF